MWDLVERARVLMEADPYDRLHLACEWRGPLYKGVDFYLTLEGYGMGTSCWYVAVAAGRRYNVTHPSDARVAACRAAIVLHAAIALKQESYARGAYGEA